MSSHVSVSTIGSFIVQLQSFRFSLVHLRFQYPQSDRSSFNQCSDARKLPMPPFQYPQSDRSSFNANYVVPSGVAQVFQYPQSDRSSFNRFGISETRGGTTFQYPQSDRSSFNSTGRIRHAPRMNVSVSTIGSFIVQQMA